MKISDFKRRIVRYYDSGICVYIRGGIGIGKSTTVEAAPEVLSRAKGGRYGIVILNAPLLTPTDLLGYLIPEHKDGRVLSRFTEPFWFVTEDGRHLSEHDGGIIFVDEEDKADTDVKKILAEMSLSNRLGPHRIPKSWRVWMGGNRKEDRSGSTKDYDHQINRRKEISIDFDLQAFEDFCFETGVHPFFIHIANQNAHMINEGVPDVQRPFCTPRSFVRCATYVMAQQPDPDKIEIDPLLGEEMQGMIGPAAAAVVTAGITLYNEMPKIADIVRDPTKAKIPERADAQILVIYNLAARVEEETMKPFITYIERMPAEYTIAFAKAACKRNPQLVNTKAFGDWCMKNATLMMAITSRE